MIDDSTFGSGSASPDIDLLQDEKILPQFRTGPQERLIEVRYHRLDTARADQAWRSLLADGRDVIIFASAIARAAGVCVGTAAYYRRAWAALEIIEDRPGSWSKDAPELNESAEVWVLSHDPDAWARAVHECDAYVLSRGVYQPAESRSPMRYAHDEPRPALVPRSLVGSRGDPAWASANPKFSPSVNRTIEKVSPRRNRESLGSSYVGGETFAESTPTVLVLVRRQSIFGDADPSRRAAPSGKWLSAVGDFGVAEVMRDLGCSRAAAYRWLTRWVEEGTVTKVSHGRYRAATNKEQPS